MGEADWWMCEHCRSLNNLSARKCYSCHRGKPKASPRASEFLGYEPVVTRDGKVRLDFPTAPTQSEPVAVPGPGLRPLRDPIPRSITAIAPRVPHGTRIVYRLHEPPPSPQRPPFAPRPMPPPATSRPIVPPPPG